MKVSTTDLSSKETPRVTWITAAAALILCTFWVVQGSAIYKEKEKRDFLAFYTGAHFALEGRWSELYDADEQFSFQRELAGVDELRPYIRPPVYALIIAPIALLPLSTGFAVWIGIQSIILIACSLLAAKRFHPDALILGALYPPAIGSIVHGQDAPLVLGITILAFVFWERGKERESGLMFGVSIFKVHLMALLPLLLVVQRRWRMLAGFSIVGGVFGAANLALVGMSGIGDFLRLVSRTDLPLLHPTPELMLNVYAIPANFGGDWGPLPYVMAAAVATLACVAALRDSWRLWPAFLIASLLVAPHTYTYDAARLFVGLLLVWHRSGGYLRTLAFLLCTPLPYFAGIFGPGFALAPHILLIALLIGLARPAWSEQPDIASPERSPA